MRALLLPTTGTPELVDYDGKLETAQAYVDGYIEALPHDFESPQKRRRMVAAYANEDGVMLGLPMNPHRGLLDVLGFPHPVVGPVLVFGTDEAGHDEGLSPDILTLLAEHGIQ